MDTMLLELMARFRALAMYYQFVHWTLRGSFFYEDHLLADRLYGDVNDAIDGIAEKGIGATGSFEHVELSEVLTRVLQIVAPYPTEPEDVESNREYWNALLTMERDLSIWMEGVAKGLTSDLGIQNMLLNFLEEGHQRVYLVRARAMGYGPDTDSETPEVPDDDDEDSTQSK